MNNVELNDLNSAVEKCAPVSDELALQILNAPAWQMPDLMSVATGMRRCFYGDKIGLCSIMNAKSGACSEDCAFCAQSGAHMTGANIYDLKSGPEIVAAYREATKYPIAHFSVVTSGPKLGALELERILEVIEQEPRGKTAWCASLGSLNASELRRLKNSGLKRFHHNLETAESFFPEICTTHTYSDRLNTIRTAKEAGLEVCSGGILGMGETKEQRVELAVALRQEKVKSIPLNFLVPIGGTKLEHVKPIQPMEIIKSIIMFRMVNPSSEIRICAGRAYLGDMQSWIFNAGATGIMIGPLLTVAGRDIQSDLRMLRDLELGIS